jgi:hypothetical protein
MESCEIKGGSCTGATKCHCGCNSCSCGTGCQCGTKCPCGCGSDKPCAAHMWMEALHEAKKEVMVEILKEKIQKAWGPKMEKTADAVLEIVKAKKTAEKERCELKAKLQNLFENA